MKKMLFVFCLFLGFFSFSFGDEGNACLGTYSAEHTMPIEKEFIVNLKPNNPDNPRTGGYAKFNLSILYSEKNAAKELAVKMDIIRHVINDVISGFLATDLQGANGRCKFFMAATASINAILTDSSIVGLVSPSFVIQP